MIGPAGQRTAMWGMVALLMAGPGCDGRALAVRDPASIQSGIYSLDIETLDDTCDPPQLTGRFTELAVSASPEGVMLREPRSTGGIGFQSYDLYAAQDYRREPSGRLAHDCAFAEDQWELVGAHEGQIEVQSRRTWTVPEACAARDAPTTDPHQLPTRSCVSERLFRYQLLRACSAGCLRFDYADPGGHTVRCACDE